MLCFQIRINSRAMIKDRFPCNFIYHSDIVHNDIPHMQMMHPLYRSLNMGILCPENNQIRIFQGEPAMALQLKYIQKAIFMNKTFLTLLVGIGIGILLAPAKGSETWKKLVDGLDEYKDKGTDLVNKGKDLLNKGKSKVQEVTDLESAPEWTK